MKSIFTSFLLLAFIFQMGISQSLRLDCPGSVEVGIQAMFTATFDAQNEPGITVVRYEWSGMSNGDELSGESGIVGSNSPLMFQTSALTHQISVVWGDFFNDCFNQITVEVYYRKDGVMQTPLLMTCGVDIMCVLDPIISGPSSIQECCSDIVTFCDESGGNQNTWSWTVTNGQIVSGQGARCIRVRPSNSGPLSVSSTASRASGNAAYTRTGAETISRFQAEISDISGPSFVCDDETMDLCVDDNICGVIGINWSVPITFSVVSEHGNCISIKPKASAPDGTVGTISAELMMEGGCITGTSTKSISIYSTETPPCPTGSVEIVSWGNFDPCKRGEGAVFTFKLNTSQPYMNGITTFSPGVIVDVPHHNVGNELYVEVCNKNLCSGEKCCKMFKVKLPTCNKRRSSTSGSSTWSTSENNIQPNGESIASLNVDKNVVLFNDEFNLDFYPNPASNSITLEANGMMGGDLTIYDLNGGVVLARNIADVQHINVDIADIKNSGVYYMVFRSKDQNITKRIIINK